MRPRTAAARLAAVVAAAALAATGCGSSGRAPSAAPTTPPRASTTTPTTTATSTGQSTPVSWSLAGAPQLDVGGGASTTLSQVVAPAGAGGSWYVVGTRLGADASAQATVWVSPDASTWTAEPLTGPGTDSEATAAATFDGNVVVVGSVGTGSARRAAVWESAGAGQAFAELPDQAAFSADPSPSPASSPGPGGARMTEVATGALGVFATGTVDGQQTVWYSTDGRHFTVDAGADKVIGASPRAEVTSLVVTPEGVFAAGSVGDGTATDGAVWTSTDGIDWHLEGDSGHVFSGQGNHEIDGLVSIERYPGITYLAVGAVDSGHGWTPASWLSPDGQSWSAPSLSFPETRSPAAGGAVAGVSAPDSGPGVAAATGTTADAVAATANGFVAVGGGGGEALVWTSTDGRSWSARPLPAAAAAAPWHAGLVAADATTTVVGDPDAGQPHLLSTATGGTVAGTWDELTTDQAVWGTPRPEALPVGLRAAGGTLTLLVDVVTPPQALGPVARSVVELTSSDGDAWEVVPPSSTLPLGAGTVEAVAGTGSPGADVGSGSTADGGPDTTAGATGSGATAAVTGPGTTAGATGSGTTAGATGSGTTAGATGSGATAAVTGAGTSAGATGSGATPEAGGLVAVGSVAPGPGTAAAAAQGSAAAWDSSDGTTWSRMGASASAFSAPGAATGADAVTATTSGRLVATGTGATGGVPGGGAPVAWTDDPGGAWSGPDPIDPATALTTATPLGVCPDGSGVAAVGVAPHDTGSDAVAWLSADGAHWQPASVPKDGTGSGVGMAGCTQGGAHLVAWGAAPGSDGAPEPALWTSSMGGRSWTLRHIAAFDSPGSADSTVGSIAALSVDGDEWLAAGGATTDASTDADGGLGLWISSDGGVTWGRVDTGAAQWSPFATASLDAAAWLGRTAVVAGTLDGRLAVWVSSPGG